MQLIVKMLQLIENTVLSLLSINKIKNNYCAKQYH